MSRHLPNIVNNFWNGFFLVDAIKKASFFILSMSCPAFFSSSSWTPDYAHHRIMAYRFFFFAVSTYNKTITCIDFFSKLERHSCLKNQGDWSRTMEHVKVVWDPGIQTPFILQTLIHRYGLRTMVVAVRPEQSQLEYIFGNPSQFTLKKSLNQIKDNFLHLLKLGIYLFNSLLQPAVPYY